MTQKARPASDVSNSGWTPQIVFKQLNEVVPDDTTFVSSSANPHGDSFEVKFPSMAWPQGGQGTLRVRLRKTGPDDVPVILSLRQGSTILAYTTVHPTTAFAEYDLVLPQTVLSQITDYTDLRLHVTAGYSIQVGCCPNLLPEILTGTVTNKVGSCACIPDSITLTWSIPLSAWLWFQHGCLGCVGPQNVPISLKCPSGGSGCTSFSLSSPNFVGAPYAPQAGCSCSPLNLVFNCSTQDGGSFTLTVTE